MSDSDPNSNSNSTSIPLLQEQLIRMLAKKPSAASKENGLAAMALFLGEGTPDTSLESMLLSEWIRLIQNTDKGQALWAFNIAQFETFVLCFEMTFIDVL